MMLKWKLEANWAIQFFLLALFLMQTTKQTDYRFIYGIRIDSVIWRVYIFN